MCVINRRRINPFYLGTRERKLPKTSHDFEPEWSHKQKQRAAEQEQAWEGEHQFNFEHAV
jgi:hypothetical protein